MPSPATPLACCHASCDAVRMTGTPLSATSRHSSSGISMADPWPSLSSAASQPSNSPVSRPHNFNCGTRSGSRPASTAPRCRLHCAASRLLSASSPVPAPPNDRCSSCLWKFGSWCDHCSPTHWAHCRPRNCRTHFSDMSKQKPASARTPAGSGIPDFTTSRYFCSRTYTRSRFEVQPPALPVNVQSFVLPGLLPIPMSARSPARQLFTANTV